MGMVDDVSAQLKDAMKAKDSTRVATLRGVRAAFLNEMKADGASDLSEEACTTILRRLEKQRKESIEAFDQGGRTEQAAAERAELAILQELLPSLADEAQTRAWVEEIIAASGASGSKAIGKVMGAMMKEHKGEVDGGLARTIAAELLGD